MHNSSPSSITKILKKALTSKKGNSLAEFAVITAMMATFVMTAIPKFSDVMESGKANKSIDELDKILLQAKNFYEIQINGVSCRRIWNAMGSALLDQNHPLNNLLDNEDPFYRNYRSHHYRCFLTEEQLKQPELVKETDYLFGTPFYYQETWWIFQSISSEISVWDLIDCKDPCSNSYYTFATRVAIDDNEELDLFMQGFYN